MKNNKGSLRGEKAKAFIKELIKEKIKLGDLMRYEETEIRFIYRDLMIYDGYRKHGFSDTRKETFENWFNEILLWAKNDETPEMFIPLFTMISHGICAISTMIPLKWWDPKFQFGEDLLKFAMLLYLKSQRSSPLLIIGDSGTGKDLLPRVIHEIGTKKNGPYEQINCAAIPSDMLESELFGYEKGAFTGAIKQKKGILESANKGTFFLDELGKMSKAHQAKLLKVLEEKKFRRFNGEKNINIDVRFIAAVQQKEIDKGKIIDDLKNRFNAYGAIKLPPLRESLSSYPLIIDHALDNVLDKMGTPPPYNEIIRDEVFLAKQKELDKLIIEPVKIEDEHLIRRRKKEIYCTWNELMNILNGTPPCIKISKEARDRLLKYDYPGNFRCLEAIWECAVDQAQVNGRKIITVDDLPEEVRSYKPTQFEQSKGIEEGESWLSEIQKIPVKDILDYAEKIKKEIVTERIKMTKGNLRAILSGEAVGEKGYQNLYKKIKKYTGPLRSYRK